LVAVLKVENGLLSVHFNLEYTSLERERERERERELTINAILDLIITIHFVSVIKSAVYL
jgi:hypothetical protein